MAMAVIVLTAIAALSVLCTLAWVAWRLFYARILFWDWNELISAAPWFGFRCATAAGYWAQALPNIVLPPHIRAMDLLMSVVKGHLVVAIADLGVPDFLQGGPLTAKELAAAIPADEGFLERILLAAASIGVLQYDKRTKRYSLNCISATLCRSHPNSVVPVAHMLKEDFKSYAHFSEGVRQGVTPFTLRTGKPSFWDGMDEAYRKTFDEAMVAINNVSNVKAALSVLPWAKYRRVIDVGGGVGGFLALILNKHPKLWGALVDLPDVIASARSLWAKQDPGFASRVQFIPGDFFAGFELPSGTLPPGKDVIVLRNILHDWDDAHSVAILKTVRKALGKAEATLAIVEMVLADTLHGTMIARRLSDMHMLALLPGGRERNVQQLDNILSQAGFKLRKVHPTQGLFFVVEAVPV